jgi:hypothetical protein
MAKPKPKPKPKPLDTSAFWKVEGVREYLAEWYAMAGQKLGPQMFWAHQEVKDLYAELVKGTKVTPDEIDRRHELALTWNSLWNEGPDEFWYCYNYELAIARAPKDRLNPDPEGTYALRIGTTGLW